MNSPLTKKKVNVKLNVFQFSWLCCRGVMWSNFWTNRQVSDFFVFFKHANQLTLFLSLNWVSTVELSLLVCYNCCCISETLKLDEFGSTRRKQILLNQWCNLSHSPKPKNNPTNLETIYTGSPFFYLYTILNLLQVIFFIILDFGEESILRWKWKEYYNTNFIHEKWLWIRVMISNVYGKNEKLQQQR